MRRRIILASFGILLIFLLSTAPDTGSARVLPNMANKVIPLGKPAGVTCNIVDPADGQTLEHGAYRVLVQASSADGIAKVTLTVDGGTHDITNNRIGDNYYYDWDITADGDYAIEAKTESTRHRKATDSITVNVGEGQPGTKWAVIIGIADYEGKDSDLWNPDEDAKEMQQILLESNYPSGNIKMLLNRKAKAGAILDAIDWLVASEGPNDEVVFFFSGHGFRVPDSNGWDTDTESDGYDEGLVSHDFYGLPDGMLAALFVNIESTKVAMIFCSCHSGGMFDDNDDAGITGPGRVLVSACKADQYGWDYFYLRNTLFFYYWGDEGLIQNNANSVESAYSYCYPFVTAEKPESQPQIWDSYSGEFCL
ncbi:MAG: caspase family protein [Candidatus Thorarchaeota archaeon]|jgi:hypothetical protein|nr:caspase family protein [Candidatus Thorarchaeota archaeon]